MTATEVIENGMKILDEKNPGWESKIDLEKLDIGSNRCILGQLYGDFCRGQFLLNMRELPSRYGFAMPEKLLAEYNLSDLNQYWKDEIQERRSKSCDH